MSRLEEWQQVNQLWNEVGEALHDNNGGLRAAKAAATECQRALLPILRRVEAPNPVDPSRMQHEWIQATGISQFLNRISNAPDNVSEKELKNLSDQYGHGNDTIGTAIRFAVADPSQT